MRFFSPKRLLAQAQLRLPGIHRITGIRARVKWQDYTNQVADIVQRINTQFLYRLGGIVRSWVIRSFKQHYQKSHHSPKGTAPYLHQTKTWISRVVRFAVDKVKMSVFIGSSYQVCRFWGAVHEHGGSWGWSFHGRSTTHPARPWLSPQVKRVAAVRNKLYQMVWAESKLTIKTTEAAGIAAPAKEKPLGTRPDGGFRK